MSYAKTCGHDRRGKPVNDDEIRQIPKHVKTLSKESEYSHLGFNMVLSQLRNGILLPKYYNPDLEKDIRRYSKTQTFEITTIGELVKERIIKVMRGNEVGSENYGTGDVPFVRTSEIANWEIFADSTHCVSESIYTEYKDRQKIQAEDILVINDGTYLMGRAAMVTDLDLKIVFQSHFRKITVLRKDKLSPYLLLALLGLEVVQKQIESKSFRQGTISTLGNRLLEVKVPIPLDRKERGAIEEAVRKIIKDKRDAKEKAQSYEIMKKEENLMGIKNKAKLGNL